MTRGVRRLPLIALGTTTALAIVLARLVAHVPEVPPSCARATALVSRPLGTRVAPAPRGVVLGISANLRSLSAAGRCARAAEIAALGVRWVREDLSWSSAESSRGRFDLRRFDDVVLYAAEHGLTVLPLLDDTPAWAAPSPREIPRAPSAPGPIAAAVAARYGPAGTLWREHPDLQPRPVRWLELYNEPYYDGQDAGRYARLVRGTAEQLSGAGVQGLRLIAVSDRAAWLAGMYAAVPDLFRYAAALALHPYSTAPPGASPGPETTRGLETVHAEMAAHGDGSVPIWLTEIGWSTCPWSSSCVDGEAVQAADLDGTLRLLRDRWSGYVAALFVFALRDEAARGISNPEDWYGLIRADGSPKPAFAVLASAARLAG